MSSWGRCILTYDGNKRLSVTVYLLTSRSMISGESPSTKANVNVIARSCLSCMVRTHEHIMGRAPAHFTPHPCRYTDLSLLSVRSIPKISHIPGELINPPVDVGDPS